MYSGSSSELQGYSVTNDSVWKLCAHTSSCLFLRQGPHSQDLDTVHGSSFLGGPKLTDKQKRLLVMPAPQEGRECRGRNPA